MKALPKARTLQAIFRCVLDIGWYGNPSKNSNSQFMCHALIRAVNAGAITEVEYLKAKKAIAKYLISLGGRSIMFRALQDAGHAECSTCAIEWSEGAGKEFYWNWSKRPKGVRV